MISRRNRFSAINREVN